MPAPTTTTRKTVWHETPRPAYRTTDAIRYGSGLAAALTVWFETALRGELRYWPQQQMVSLTGPVKKTEDDFLSDCTKALAAAVEWDGYLLATELEKLGWPADADLVGRCSRWSCARRQARLDAYFAQERRKKDPEAARA